MGIGSRAVKLILDGFPMYEATLHDTLFNMSDEDEFLKYEDQFFETL
jgi:hypothetical protein